MTYKTLFLVSTYLYTTLIYSQDYAKIAQEIMLKDSIPEMAFAIVTKDSIIIKQVIGHHKISEIKLAQNSNTSDLFHLGSNTKAITGFIAAYLVENKKINWNTKLFDLFPELKNNSNLNYLNITLEDLLTHRASIQPFTSGNEYQKLPKFKGNKQKRRSRFSKYVLTLDSLNSSKSYNYSNAGYSIATLMLEKVSGKSWEELVTIILKQKSKIDFAFGWPNRNLENQPYGHWIENGKIISIPSNTKYDLSMAEPAGDISMNIENYAKFIQLNIQGLSGENNILNAETYKILHNIKNDYAIGWANFTNNNNQISEHTGSDGTFFAFTQIDRKKLIGYIILVNSGTESSKKGVYEMLNFLKKNN